ncbi:tetratricopeptide repeat protein [Ornithinimicrobium sp. Arc0846-15]|nr:tetratricopeptide repeat protein [Ornithinimicrobium laminariae]
MSERNGGFRGDSGRQGHSPRGGSNGQGAARSGPGGYRGSDDSRQGPGFGSRDDRGPSGRPVGPPRAKEPEIPSHLEASQADRSVFRELRTLTKDNAEGVALHLLAIEEFLENEELERAQEHAQTAVRRAGRVPIVREYMGLVHYRKGEWSKALSEFRTARRMSGSHHLLPLIADTERGLGRPEKAIELGQSREVDTLAVAERMEMAVVVSGARRDLGQTGAAVQTLREIARTIPGNQPWSARVYYAYADALIADGKQEDAAEWLQRAADADDQGQTDAAERLGDPAEEFIDLDDFAEDDFGDTAYNERGRDERPRESGRD